MKPYHLLGATMAVLAFAAGAQNLKPGLWQITHNTGAGSDQAEQGLAQMQQRMAGMPPQQRKMMQDMMARQGVKMEPAGGMSVKVCMTREMVEKSELPAQQGDCRTTQQSRSGNTMKIAFSCASPPSSGEGLVTFNGSEAYDMKMAVSTTVDGKPRKTTMDSTGRWLASDCGSVKPYAAPKN